MRRSVFIVLDGVGVGALPDAGRYGDEGSNTLGNLSRVVQLRSPNLQRLGLGNIAVIAGVPPIAKPRCLCGRLAPQAVGKDTTVGHWEHMGLITVEPFPTHPQGFPDDVIDPFSERIGRGVLGNRPASGTQIIAELGEEHMLTGKPIVYTSADSVFQIATHVEVVPLEQLYSWCRSARELLSGRHAVARVIARPFEGRVGAFVRTADRRDFSLAPTGSTYLDVLAEAGIPTLALGKISEIFAGKGVTTDLKVSSNADNLALVLGLLKGRSSAAVFDHGLLMTNLVEFDMAWGHRNDVDGFAAGLEVVDAAIPEILGALEPDDQLFITADHGVDPTTPSTDHSREYVPLLMFPRPPGTPQAVYEGAFSDTGATITAFLTGKDAPLAGDVITRLQPSRGWRGYTPVVVSSDDPSRLIPCRVGLAEAEEGASWLGARLGPAPDTAIVLGSGLAPRSPSQAATVPYGAVPHWARGGVAGHRYEMSTLSWLGTTVALLKGRVHEYEGYDLGEAQLQVRTLATWGVEKLILICACGAVDEGLMVGEIAVVTEVLDFQHGAPGERPARLRASDLALADSLKLPTSVHASVPGPQYETPAELSVLRHLGAATVSMSPAAEVRAAHDEGLDLVVLAVVANVGDTSHEEVLAGTARATEALTSAIEQVLRVWRTPASLY